MKQFNLHTLFSTALLIIGFGMNAHAQQASSSSTGSTDSTEASSAASASSAWNVEDGPQSPPRLRKLRDRLENNDDNAVVSIGSDAVLAAGESADDVVAIVGSATSDGEVKDSVVAVLGDTRVSGHVGDSAVAVLGNVYVNGRVDSDIVAVLGNVQLGPLADVYGKVVTVLGHVDRDPAAVVHGGVENAGTRVQFGQLDNFSWDWLKSWIKNCLFYGRLLAFAPGLGWAWGLALGSLALYVLTALAYPRSVQRCVRTLETQPGLSFLTAIVSVFLSPLVIGVVCMILAVTIIGILAIPFVAIAALAVSAFGKLVMLTWLGRLLLRSFKEGPMAHAAMATLVGGLIVTGLYAVPIIGFIVFHLLKVMGFGVVVYTLVLAMQERRAAHAPSGTPPSAPSGGTNFSQQEFVGAANANQDTLNQSSEPNDAGNANSAGFAHAQADASASTNTAQGFNSNAPHAAHTMRPTAAAVLAYPRADFGIRMGALLIDTLLAAVVFRWLPGSFLLPLAVYGALMWKLKGSTIGGIVCHLQVARVDGRELDWPTVIVRALSCFLSLFVMGLGFLWILFDRDKQGWHDKLAGTVVVRVPQGVSLV